MYAVDDTAPVFPASGSSTALTAGSPSDVLKWPVFVWDISGADRGQGMGIIDDADQDHADTHAVGSLLHSGKKDLHF